MSRLVFSLLLVISFSQARAQNSNEIKAEIKNPTPTPTPVFPAQPPLPTQQMPTPTASATPVATVTPTPTPAAPAAPAIPKNKVTGTPVTKYISTLPVRGIDFAATITRIAFGSGMNQDYPAPIYKAIQENKPDLFLALGDNVFAIAADQQPLAEQYRKLDQVSEYRSLREKVPFMATWDDQDYGQKNGSQNFAEKENSRRDFLNYWSYVKNSIPLEQDGIYHSKIIGPKKKMVQVIVLDTRYFKSPLENNQATQDPKATVLGHMQWTWFEDQLHRPADIRLIVSSLPVIANDPKGDKWGDYPIERQRFFDLLKKTHARNVIVLSGNHEAGSIAKVDLKDYGPLFEVTASPLNYTSTVNDTDAHYVGKTYNKENFGLAHIDWKKRTVEVEIRDIQNKTMNSLSIKLH
jgi:alkaline phosphatase D